MAIFDEKIEIRERCKGVHCVDLGESFPTSIYLQKSVSIQPRTSPSKFGGKFNSLFICLLSREPSAMHAKFAISQPESSARPAPSSRSERCLERLLGRLGTKYFSEKRENERCAAGDDTYRTTGIQSQPHGDLPAI